MVEQYLESAITLNMFMARLWGTQTQHPFLKASDKLQKSSPDYTRCCFALSGQGKPAQHKNKKR